MGITNMAKVSPPFHGVLRTVADENHVAVVGGGIATLAAAAVLARRGSALRDPALT
jgi:NADPH-dependent 2,4-dienoyl-CoA reductase/sulfur reductase-like enzyme